MWHALLRLLAVPLALQVSGAKVYKCKWPRSVLSSGDPNLTVTLSDGSQVRCDRTLQSGFICPAACDYSRSDPDVCFGPIEDGDVCNTVWQRNSQAFYKLHSMNATHACTRRYNSDCSGTMGGEFCQELNSCYGSYQEVVIEHETFVARYGYKPSFLQQPWEILEPPSCGGRTRAQCCQTTINFYRCLHGAPPMVYHEGIAASAQAWAVKTDKGRIHSNWGGSFFPHYTEVITWGTAGCERGAKAWYQEIGFHNFSIKAVQSSGSMTSGHMVLLLWRNHTMLGCGFDDHITDAPIVVCDFAWAHQGHKGLDAWEANLFDRTGATQDTCRSVAVGSLSLPVLLEGQDLSAEQVAALRAGTLNASTPGGGSPGTAAGTTTTAMTAAAGTTTTAMPEAAGTTTTAMPTVGTVPAVEVTFTMQGVDYTALEQNETVKSEFKDAVKDGVISEVGSGLTRADISVRLFAGSVGVEATIIPPTSGVDAAVLQSSVQSSATQVTTSITQRVQSIPSIASVQSGTIGISSGLAVVATVAPTQVGDTTTGLGGSTSTAGPTAPPGTSGTSRLRAGSAIVLLFAILAATSPSH